MRERITGGIAQVAATAREALHEATRPGGFMDAASEAIARRISPQAFADPPVLQEGYQEVDGEMLPARRWVCPWCEGLLVPDAIDFGAGYPPRSLPVWCPSCGRALAVFPGEGVSVGIGGAGRCRFLRSDIEDERE